MLAQFSTGRTSGPPRILLVEDELLIRFAMAEELRDRGVSVIEAANSDEALDILHGDVPVDLVFTDHVMPEGSLTGAQLATQITREYPTLKVIVTSAHFRDMAEWPEQVLSKPYHLIDTAARLVELALQNRDRERL